MWPVSAARSAVLSEKLFLEIRAGQFGYNWPNHSNGGQPRFEDRGNNIVTGNPWTLYWIPFVRGGVSGIDTRSRYIETLADIERTSLDYYATIRSLYQQRRAALIRHEQEENLPPKAGFSRREDPGTPSTVARSAVGPGAVSEH